MSIHKSINSNIELTCLDHVHFIILFTCLETSGQYYTNLTTFYHILLAQRLVGYLCIPLTFGSMPSADGRFNVSKLLFWLEECSVTIVGYEDNEAVCNLTKFAKKSVSDLHLLSIIVTSRTKEF